MHEMNIPLMKVAEYRRIMKDYESTDEKITTPQGYKNGVGIVFEISQEAPEEIKLRRQVS